MDPFAYLRQLFSSLFHRASLDAELDEELRAHIARHADDLERSGLPRHEAERQARIAFGSPAKAKEQCREQLPSFWLETLWSDLRFGLRLLRKNPTFTAVVIVTLALGIGANTAIFSVVDAVLFKPLPYTEPLRLVTVSESNRPNDQATRNSAAPGNFLAWRDRNRVFEQTVAVELPGFSITGSDRPERVLGAALSAGTLHMLGLPPALGREFTPSDDRYGAAPVAMLTHALWQRRFASDPSIVGKTVRLDTTSYTIVGVLPAGLTFPEPDVQLWVPLEQTITPHDMRWLSSHYLDVYARLKPGVSLTQARDDINRIAANMKHENPDSNSGAAALVLPLQEDLSGTIRPALLILFAAVTFVLLIACANVANLLLVRSFTRHKELATRLALGAAKTRLLRQMLTESLLLGVIGGCAGLLVASWTRQTLLKLRPETLPQFNVIQTDGRVLLFTLFVSVATAVLFGLLPALRSTAIDINPALHGSSQNTTVGKDAHRLRNILVAVEIAISLVLLVGAGLTIRSFLQLRDTPLGFRSDHTVTARISIPTTKYTKDDQVVRFYDQVLEQVRATPGVESAAMVSFLPLTGHNFDNSFDIVGRPERPPSDRNYALVRFVDPQYFQVLQIPLASGRVFDNHDRAGSSRAMLISESMKKLYFPDSTALGEHLLVYLGEDQSPWQIVGVVKDVRANLAEAPQPTMYFPYAQMPYRFMVLAVRTQADPKSMIEIIRQTVSNLDPDQPIYQTRTLDQLIELNLVPWRFSMTLLSIFAAIALLLAAAGIYGVMAYFVAQRTHEVGVRMALGALPRDVLRLVVGQGAKLALIGVTTGLLASLALTRLISSLLFQVDAYDPFTFTAMALILVLVALLACYIPARRATKVDPTMALRCE
jgi:predicted permease